MKTVVLGDIHGRDVWKEIISKENPNRVIFLGDYFTSHDDISEETQINNYKEILEFKKNTDIEVIMLRGNHDMEACWYSWAKCFPAFCNEFLFEEKNKQEFLDNTQWVYVDGDIIFSHAGISEEWYKKLGVNSVEEINTLEPSKFFGFTAGPDKPFDNYGDSIYQPCTWIRPFALMESAIDGIHIVGHTRTFNNEILDMSNRMKEPEKLKNTKVWLCDTLPNQYLIIEEGNFIVKNVEIK